MCTDVSKLAGSQHLEPYGHASINANQIDKSKFEYYLPIIACIRTPRRAVPHPACASTNVDCQFVVQFLEGIDKLYGSCQMSHMWFYHVQISEDNSDEDNETASILRCMM